MVSREEVLELMKNGMKYRGAAIYAIDENEEIIVENRDDLQTVGRVNFGKLVFVKERKCYLIEEDCFVNIVSGDSIENIPLKKINYSDFIGRTVSFYDISF